MDWTRIRYGWFNSRALNSTTPTYPRQEGKPASAPRCVSSPAPRNHGATASKALLPGLQQQFLEGKHTDMVIRVRIQDQQQGQQQQEEEQEEEQQPPAAKRKRMSKAAAAAAAAAEAAAVTAAAEAAAAAAAAADVHMDIKAHSLVLRTLSPYVDGALSGEWAEAAERLIELTVDSEQELDVLRLLIKRCYTASYAFDDGKLLPFDTRVRLAVRADALEFVGAVNQLVESLSLGLDFEQALACLETLPPAVEQHAGISAVRNRAVQVLNNHLGPVVGMFEEAGELMNGTMPLRDVVKQLSPAAFKRLLASEALQLQSENEAYALLCAWLHQSPHVTDGAQRLAFFMELAPLMRYHHMTPDFVAITVCRCPLMQKTDLLPSVMTAAFVQ